MARELIYRVSINTSDAKRQAANIRATFESELRKITVGKLDTSSLKAATNQAKLYGDELKKAAQVKAGEIDTSHLQRATGEAQRLRAEMERAGAAASDIKVAPISNAGGAGIGGAGIGGGALAGLGGALAGGLAVGGAVTALKTLGGAIDGVARRGAILTQLNDVLDSYTKSIGSNSEAFISAARKASAGTISNFDLILNANRAIQFEVAQTAEQYAQLIELSTALGRAQGISDTQALEFLTTGLARESRLILDNLGLIINVSKANADYADSIGKTSDQLTTAERKQALLAEAVRQGAVAIEANRNAFDSAATQYERFDANAQNLKDSLGKLAARILSMPFAKAAGALEEYNEKYFQGGVSDDTLLRRRAELQAEINKIEADGGKSNVLGIQFDDEMIGRAETYRDTIAEIDILIRNMKSADPNPITGPSLEDFQQGFSTKKLTFSASENAATNIIAQESEQIEAALIARAKQAVANLGAEGIASVTAQMQSVRTQMNAAIDEMIARGLSDPQQISFESTALTESLLATFDQLEAAASIAPTLNLGNLVAEFDALGAASANFGAGFVDFLPAVAAARDELFELGNELLTTGTLTDEQAARLEYLSAVAYSVSDGTSHLGQVVNELGSAFLESNDHAAALVGKMFEVEASFRAGLISADIYAGVTAALGGDLLLLASNAGVATSAIWALTQAQSNMASAGAMQIGAGISGGIQTQQAASARENNRRELDRVAKAEAAQAKQIARHQESAARSAARTTEGSARKAGKELEKGAKKASQELISALKGVEGLFSASQVTEDDMKLGSDYTDKADEYLRRLRDEVINGVDWADVSIEEAKAAIEGIGVNAAQTKEGILAQFEQLWNNQALFSDAANIDKFINDEAVQQALDLQEKSAQGEKNILAHFGVVVDEAVDAVIAGASGGGGGGGVSFAPLQLDPIEPAKLIDVDLLTDGVQDGLTDYVGRAASSIRKVFTDAKEPVLDTNRLFGGIGGKIGSTLQERKAQAEVVITASPAAAQIGAYLAKEDSAAGINLTPTFDAVAAQAELDKLELTLAIKPTLAVDSGEALARELGDQLSKQSATLVSHGTNIGGNLKTGLIAALGLGKDDEAVKVDIAGLIGGNLQAQQARFSGQGETIGGLLKAGIAKAFANTDTAGLQDELDKLDLKAEIKASLSAENLLTINGLITALTPTIKAKVSLSAENLLTINGIVTALTPTIKAKIKLDAENIIGTNGLIAGLTPGIVPSITAFTIAEGVRPADVGVLGVLNQFAIDETALRSAELTVPVKIKLEEPKAEPGVDPANAPNAITPLITGINTQIRASTEGLKREGATVAQIIIAGIIAHWQAGAGAEGDGVGAIAAALMTNVATQFTTSQNMFYALGFIPAGSVESGFKAYVYTGMDSGILDSITNGIRTNAENYQQRGATIGNYVQRGLNDSFSGEVGLSLAVAAGTAWGSAFQRGVLNQLAAGSGLVTAITDKVLEGIATEMEQP